MNVPKSKDYYRKKNKQNYEANKKLSQEYRDFGSNFGKSFSQFKRERKKQIGC